VLKKKKEKKNEPSYKPWTSENDVGSLVATKRQI
jgi:hypothetical protein